MLKQEPDGRSRIRMLAMHHVQLGKSLSAVAEIVQVHWKTVQTWLRVFRESGLHSLHDAPRTGAPEKIVGAAENWLHDKVVSDSQSKTGGCATGRELHQQLKDLYGIQCSLQTVYNKLHALNFSWITARSIHPHTDVEVQEAYKKTSLRY